MPGPDFKNLSKYEDYIKAKIANWPAERCTILAAGMAERWLRHYAEFSKSEKWGDTAVLRQSLDAVWGWAESRGTMRADWRQLRQQVHEVTPHMDDFDANEALCACVMVDYAIDCSTERDNRTPALMGVLSGLEAVLPDVLSEERLPARLWRQAHVQKEIQKQVSLIDKVAALADTAHTRQALAGFLADPGITGEAPPKPVSQAPAGRTNEELHRQYQQIIQQDVKSAARNLDPRKHPEMAAMLYLGMWMGRYGRRKQILTGEYGPLADQAGVKALIARNQADDRAETRPANWDKAADDMIQITYQNPYNGLDAAAVDSPHAYGPSLRRLWVEARGRSISDQQAWESIEAWAYHLPEAWSRKPDKKNLAALEEYLSRSVSWVAGGDPHLPWAAEVDGVKWQVRLNDFPDEILYTLLIDGEEAGEFHEWPHAWVRG